MFGILGSLEKYPKSVGSWCATPQNDFIRECKKSMKKNENDPMTFFDEVGREV